MTLTFNLRTHKCIQLFYKLSSINSLNIKKDPRKNGREITEPRNKQGRKDITTTERPANFYNNREVFRLCGQTLITLLVIVLYSVLIMKQLIPVTYSFSLILGTNKNNTNHPISSNSHPSATANKAIHSLKIGMGYKTNRNII